MRNIFCIKITNKKTIKRRPYSIFEGSGAFFFLIFFFLIDFFSIFKGRKTIIGEAV